jgi:hypothetical protein
LGRQKFVVLLLGAIALASSFWFLLDIVGAVAHRSPVLRVAEFEDRFVDFPKPEPHMVYGYVSDNAPNDPRSLWEYHLTQYVLAPAIIKDSANEPLVVVNYHTKGLDLRMLRNNHLDPFHDFGNGVALCRRSQR